MRVTDKIRARVDALRHLALSYAEGFQWDRIHAEHYDPSIITGRSPYVYVAEPPESGKLAIWQDLWGRWFTATAGVQGHYCHDTLGDGQRYLRDKWQAKIQKMIKRLEGLDSSLVKLVDALSSADAGLVGDVQAVLHTVTEGLQTDPRPLLWLVVANDSEHLVQILRAEIDRRTG